MCPYWRLCIRCRQHIGTVRLEDKGGQRSRRAPGDSVLLDLLLSHTTMLSMRNAVTNWTSNSSFQRWKPLADARTATEPYARCQHDHTLPHHAVRAASFAPYTVFVAGLVRPISWSSADTWT